MFTELLNLTEKERQRIFSRKGELKAGDFLCVDEDVKEESLYKLLYADRKNDVYVVISKDDRDVFCRDDMKELKRIDISTFNSLKQKRLYHSFCPSTPERGKSILKRLLSSIYSEDRFEIVYAGNMEFQITIHYPEIVISNTLGMSHTIRDLYFRVNIWFNVKERTVRIYNLCLARTTFEDREYRPTTENSFYMFSHTKYETYPWEMKSSRSFCFGDTDLKQFVRRADNGNLGILDIKKFFLHMNSYFTWESIEGTPFHKISGIGQYMFRRKEINPLLINVYNDFLNIQTNNVLRGMNDFSFTFDNEDGEMMLKILNVNTDVDSGEFVRNLLNIEDFPEEMKCYIVGGVPVENCDSSITEYVKRFNGIYSNVSFKGNTPKVKIIHTSTHHFEKMIHPDIISEIQNRITEKFKTYLLLHNG